jgi:LacI family sucrose operon transcriptional repressor
MPFTQIICGWGPLLNNGRPGETYLNCTGWAELTMTEEKSRRLKVSLEEFARLAKTSRTTVSLVLNGKAEQYRISARTRDRVIALADELNYSPNTSARNLRLKKTQTIGLVITDISNYFFARLAQSLEQICRENGYLLQISASEDREDLEEQIISNFIAKSVDGLIIASVHQSSDFLADLVNATPTVFIDRRLAGDHCSSVESNNYDSAYRVVSHLAHSAPREIAYIGGLKAVSSNQDRLRGYKDAIRDAGIDLDPALVIEKDFTAEAGQASILALLDSMGRLPDAVFTASFTLLEGVLRALGEQPGQLPDDMQIATYDDHPLLDYAALRIHSVRQDYSAIATQAFCILQDYFEGRTAVRRETVPAKVLIR